MNDYVVTVSDLLSCYEYEYTTSDADDALVLLFSQMDDALSTYGTCTIERDFDPCTGKIKYSLTNFHGLTVFEGSIKTNNYANF